jgi:hypothetical protein
MTPTTVDKVRAEYSSALTLAHSVLFAASGGAVAFGLYCVASHKSHLYLRLVPALVVGVIAPILLKLRVAVRLMAAAVFIGCGVGLYLAQAFALVLVDPDRPALQVMEKEAKAAGISFDSRTRVQVIADLRKQGVAAYPPFYPYLLLDSPLRVDGNPTIALSSMSNVLTVCCNDSGQYLTYTTDEHGFANPPGSWSQTSIDLALVGASSAVGESVPQADNLLSQLRTRYPSAMTLGAGGNGPVLELASIREYLPVVKPKRVLWLFAETHTPEYLAWEKRFPRVLRYLDPTYKQGLFEKQDSLNRAIAQYFNDGIRTELAAESLPRLAKNFLLLKDLRTVLYFYVDDKTAKPKPYEFDARLYEQALREGLNTVSSWGGSIILVYYPDSSRYAGISGYTPALRQSLDRTHATFMEVANRLNLPVIDLSPSFPDLPASEAAGNKQYFYPYPAHFKPAGYRVAGTEILSWLEKQP